MTYDIYGIENNMASGETRVRFRVWEVRGALTRLVDDCYVTLEGRYKLDDPELLDEVQIAYTTEMNNG